MRRSTLTNGDGNRQLFSEGSKATSTPRTHNSPNISLSPSISNITSPSNRQEINSNVDDSVVDKDFSIEERRRNSASEVEESSESSSDDDSNLEPEKVLGRIVTLKWQGFWSSLKPQHKESLYFKIMYQPNETESIAIDFINSYQKNPKRGILCLLQFFVDLCCYKNVSVGKYYNFEKGGAKDLIKMMEGELVDSDLRKTGKFLFMKATKFEMKVEATLAAFLKHLILSAAKTEILYDEFFVSHLLDFVNCMSFSLGISVRVTGIILTLNLLNVFINLYQHINSEHLQRSAASEGTEELLNEKQTTLGDFIDFLYLTVDKNCLFPDKRCYVGRLRCAQEMIKWIKMFPNIFITKRKCLGRLLRLAIDENQTVRLAALSTIEKLIKSESDQLHAELKNKIEPILIVTYGRIVDVSHKVSIKAVSIFTSVLNRYSQYILKEHKTCIFRKVFINNIPFASECAKFVVNYFRSKENGDEFVIRSLSKTAFTNEEFAERLFYFIDVCAPVADELKKYNVIIISLLLNVQIDLNEKKHILAVLKETIRHFLVGSRYQSGREEVPQSREEHVTVALAVIPHFEQLIMTFQTDKRCLNNLFEILTFINHDYCRSEDLENNYNLIFSLIKDVFDASVDKETIEKICDVFHCLTEKQIYNRAIAELEKIKNNYVNRFKEDMLQLSPDGGRDLLIRLRETSLKITSLFAKFDMTNMLKWEEIFEVWGTTYFKVLKYLIICCKWHLVWSLRRLIHSENNDTPNPLLYSNCKNFVQTCMQLLRNGGKKSVESFLVFESLCDYYCIFNREMKRRRQYDNFIIKLNDPENPEILSNFLTCIIENNSLPLHQRQLHLCKFIEIIYMGALPTEYIAKFLRLYHSHFNEFGEIINDVLKELSLQVPALPLLIITTLIEMYEEILAKNRIVNIANEESNNLKLLAKKFASSNILKSRNDCLKLVNMSVNYSFKREDNHMFLHFVRYFARILSEDAKTEAYEHFLQIVPENCKENSIVLLFADNLKPHT